MDRPCPVCHGHTTAYDTEQGCYTLDPCKPCHGTGQLLPRQPPVRVVRFKPYAKQRRGPRPAPKTDRTRWTALEISEAIDSATYAEYVRRMEAKGERARSTRAWMVTRENARKAGIYVRPALRGAPSVRATRELWGR